MVRDSQIPLFLWITTAIVVHLASGGGATHVVSQIEETLQIGRFASSVRNHVRLTHQSLEVATLEESELDQQDELDEPDPTKLPEPEEEPEQDDAKPVPEDTTKKLVPDPVEPEDEKLDPPEEKKEEEKEEEKEKKEEEKAKEEEKKKIVLPTPPNRIAVRQHVEDKNQDDNPDAEFLADHANRVKEQTQARITSNDQNDPEPTPGGHHSGPDKNPGNSTESRVAHHDEAPGEPDQPPTPASEGQEAKAAAPEPAPAAIAGARRLPTPAQPPTEAQQGQRAQAAVEAQEAVPMTLSLPGGTFTMPHERAGRAEQRARKARRHQRARRGHDEPTALLGLGAEGLTENGINLNLSPSTALAVVGKEQLARERTRDAERRRSEHRGSWQDTSLERYRSSIENYVAHVKPGNQTALNAAHAPFASYLNAIHNRLHPVFADRFLASLDRLPSDHPMNDMEMTTNVEIVVRPQDGYVVSVGVTKSSGVTAFDIGALDSVKRASPFGTAPPSIISPDGNVYFHWEFHRRPQYACSTYFARPYIIKVKPKSVPPKTTPPSKPFQGEEAPPGERRRGSVDSNAAPPSG